MTGFLGIDHPLILVRDIDAARELYASLGFTMTPVGKHPWGTSTSLAMFDGCLLELMSIYDESLIDVSPTGDFRFGRLIRDHLAEREGISMQALNSTDAAADAAVVMKRGIVCQGSIEFGRDVILPDGGRDRTATTLKILYDPQFPRLTNFICQQHKPELIYVPKWMAHPNGATGICQLTVLAPLALQPRIRARFIGLYGAEAIKERCGGFVVGTGNGRYVILDRAAAEAEYGVLPRVLSESPPPFCLAVHVSVTELARVRPFIDRAGVANKQVQERLVLLDAAQYGNVFLIFDAAPTRENCSANVTMA
jgi:catechol 2,3-dioxygenase-like lactoylglutathione lyase family enzyme